MSKTILVVEDNELNLKLFCELLRAHRFVADAVRDGREAVARARAAKPDLIVMDIQLPHVSGLDLIGQIRADPMLHRVPIMAVTAYAGREDEDRIRRAGADDYVSKPISVARFIAAVRALVPPVGVLDIEQGTDIGPDHAPRPLADPVGAATATDRPPAPDPDLGWLT